MIHELLICIKIKVLVHCSIFSGILSVLPRGALIEPRRGFRTRSNTNQPVQSQKARSLKFGIYEEEMHYQCSENKGTDQLSSYCSYRQKSGFLTMLLIFFKKFVFIWNHLYLYKVSKIKNKEKNHEKMCLSYFRPGPPERVV